MKETKLFVGAGRDDGVRVKLVLGVFNSLFSMVRALSGSLLTLKFCAIPETRKAHQSSVFPLHVMRQLLFASVLFEPLVETLDNDNASLLLLHGVPHSTAGSERVIAAVDGPHH